MNWRRGLLSVMYLGLSLAGAASALAEPLGFAVDRFEPSERGSDWFASESLDFRGDQRPAVGMVFDYARKPLVVYEPNGDVASAPVRDQLFSHLGGAAILENRVRLALNLPIALVQTGDGTVYGREQVASENKSGIGDIRATVDVRLVGRYRGIASVAAGFRLMLPTGSQSSFTGDGEPRFGPRVMFAGELAPVVYALQVGYLYHGNDEIFAGVARGREVDVAAALGVRLLEGHLLLGPELFGSTVFRYSDSILSKPTTPVELILGGHFQTASGLRVGAGAGPGLTRGLGAPAWRGLLTLEWLAPFEEAKPNGS